LCLAVCKGFEGPIAFDSAHDSGQAVASKVEIETFPVLRRGNKPGTLTMNWLTIILLVNVATTWFMVGLIWLIQIVHYPLFRLVGESTYTEYQRWHQTLITWVVGPIMMAELITSGLLVWLVVRSPLSLWVQVNLVLVVAIWIATATMQVPAHGRLSEGFDVRVHRRLVFGNWFRTVAWTTRGVLILMVVGTLLN
jgi:hypothetical protein